MGTFPFDGGRVMGSIVPPALTEPDAPRTS